MPTDFSKLLNNTGEARPSTFGLDPSTIANFSGQQQAGNARKMAMIQALANKKENTMLDLEVEGKMYKVPAQHYVSFLNDISLLK